MIWALVGLAQAESAWVLGAGEGVVYGGAGLSTFHYGASGNLRDRQLRTRVDAYGAVGFGPGLQVSLDAPFVHNRLIDHPDHPPRPCGTDFCANTTSVGEAGLHLRWAVLGGATRLVVGAGVRSDAWNAGTRGRWTNAGFGGTVGVGEVVAARDIGPIEVLGRGYYAWAPQAWLLDHTGALVQVGGGSRVRVEGFGTFHTRLGGVEYGDGWTDDLPAEWIWAQLNYREVQAGGKLSIPLGDRAGVHASAQRVVWQQNGPKDTWSGALGVHRMLGEPAVFPDAEIVRWDDVDLETVATELYDLEQERHVGRLVIQVDPQDGERLLDGEAWLYDNVPGEPTIALLAQVSKNLPPIPGVEVDRFEVDLESVILVVDFPSEEALLLTVGPLRYALPDAEPIERQDLDDGTLRVTIRASRP